MLNGKKLHEIVTGDVNYWHKLPREVWERKACLLEFEALKQDGPPNVALMSIDRFVVDEALKLRQSDPDDRAMDESIASFRPITTRRDGTIIDGHRRYEACKRLGLIAVRHISFL